MTRFDNDRNVFAAIPSGVNCKLGNLDAHEYYGDTFSEGEGTYLLAIKDNGKPIVIFTHGEWNEYLKPLRDYDTVVLQHTQSGAKTYTERKYMVLRTKEDLEAAAKEHGDVRVAVWTLK